MSIPLSSLGNTGLKVSRLGYGTMQFKELSSRFICDHNQFYEHAKKLLNTALDSGINFIDTAYSYEHSEECIGRAIPSRREEFILATKAGRREPAAKEKRGYWRKQEIICSVEKSLERLKTDYIDILQLHNPTYPEIVASDAIEALDDLRKTGKIHFVGISSGSPHIDKFLDLNYFEVIQLPYSVLFLENSASIERAARMGVGIIARGGMAEGVPMGGGSERALYMKLKNRFEASGIKEIVDENIAEFMLKSTLSNSSINTAIVGSLDVDHIKANAITASASFIDSKTLEEVTNRVRVLMNSGEE